MGLKIDIRKSTEKDMETVHQLIMELAVYENAGDQMINTVAQLIEDGFGSKKIFDCIVAEVNSDVVGFALYYTSYSTWKGRSLYLEDFLVTERLRGKGIGKLLFDEVFKIAKNGGYGRFEWQVLDWNKPAINFYEKYNAILDPEWLNGKIIFK